MGSKRCPVSHSDGMSISSLSFISVYVCVCHTLFFSQNSHPILVAILETFELWRAALYRCLGPKGPRSAVVEQSCSDGCVYIRHQFWQSLQSQQMVLLAKHTAVRRLHCQLHLGEFNKTGFLREARFLQGCVNFSVQPKKNSLD